MCRYIPWPGEHVTGFPAGTSIPTTATTDDHKKKTFPHLLANTWEKISGQIRATGKTKAAVQWAYQRTPYLVSRESSICAVTSPESSKPTVPRICRVVQLCNAFGYTRGGRQSIKDMTQEELEQRGYGIFPSFLNRLGKRRTIAFVVAS